MSDFLRNLRSSHKKDKSDPKRNLDGHYYPQNEPRKTQDRKSSSSETRDDLWITLKELMPQLVDNTSVLTVYFEKMAEQNESLVEAKIRQYNSMTVFLNNLNKIFTEDIPFSKSKTKVTASYASGTRYTKDEIMTIIRTMRKSGTTFAIIAEYLKDKGIPTFSGRGEWHAQTIHRLCK